MPILKLQRMGAGIAVILDDGSRVLCHAAPGGLWFPTQTTEPTDPTDPTDPTPNEFKWMMNPDALNTRNGQTQDGFMTAGRPTHNGTDLSFPPTFYNGMPIKSIADGTVVRTYWDASGLGGWNVEVNHGRYRSGYAHLGVSGDGQFSVSPGQVITQGTALAPAGTTGSASSGPHLHFMIADMNLGGVSFWDNLIDPEAFMATHNPLDLYV